MDNLTKEQRHLCMSRIRSRNTKPETVVRKILRELRQKYRTYASKLPGNPDIVIPKKNTVIFINGCFWHQHKNCNRANIPKSNRKYWLPKIRRNIERDKDNAKALRKLKWKSVIIWECQTKGGKKVKKIIKRCIEK